jgi:ATP-binding protein involved in chromosome partitioning
VGASGPADRAARPGRERVRRGRHRADRAPVRLCHNGPMPSREQILKALEAVIDPELRQSIVELGMVRSIDARPDGTVAVTVSLTTPGCPIRSHFQTAVTQAVGALEGVGRVDVGFDVLTDTEKGALQRKLGRGGLPEGALAQVSNIVCVGSGKGGVGKSTVTANLAAALAAEGRRVGVLDADVWGYSIPRMFGVAGRPPVSPERKIVPLEAHGVKVMSIGFFVAEDSAVVWRGPMLHKALTQFLEDVAWGELDFLRVDLPPGTGDVSMTLAQLLPQARFLIVTTPQPTAQKVARRAAEMAHKVNLEIAGVLENMAGFVTPAGERFQLFGEGGGQELADELDVPLLGKVPLTMPLREQADAGVPLVLIDPDDPAAQAVRHAARGLVALFPLELPILQTVGAGLGDDEPPAPAPAPGGISLPMAG